MVSGERASHGGGGRCKIDKLKSNGMNTQHNTTQLLPHYSSSVFNYYNLSYVIEKIKKEKKMMFSGLLLTSHAVHKLMKPSETI